MKSGILETAALIIALYLAAPAPAETPNWVEQFSAVDSGNTKVF